MDENTKHEKPKLDWFTAAGLEEKFGNKVVVARNLIQLINKNSPIIYEAEQRGLIQFSAKTRLFHESFVELLTTHKKNQNKDRYVGFTHGQFESFLNTMKTVREFTDYTKEFSKKQAEPLLEVVYAIPLENDNEQFGVKGDLQILIFTTIDPVEKKTLRSDVTKNDSVRLSVLWTDTEGNEKIHRFTRYLQRVSTFHRTLEKRIHQIQNMTFTEDDFESIN